MTTKASTATPQRMKNQAAIDLLEQWLNETPTPAEIEAERKSLAEIMAYLMKPDAPQSEIGEKCRAEGCQWIAPSVTTMNAAPQKSPTRESVNSASLATNAPAAAASLLSGNPEFYSSPPSASRTINALAATSSRRGAEPGQPALGAPASSSDKDYEKPEDHPQAQKALALGKVMGMQAVERLAPVLTTLDQAERMYFFAQWLNGQLHHMRAAVGKEAARALVDALQIAADDSTPRAFYKVGEPEDEDGSSTVLNERGGAMTADEIVNVLNRLSTRLVTMDKDLREEAEAPPSATLSKLPSLPDEIQEWCWHMDTALEQDGRHAAMALQAAWPHVSKWLRANVAPSSVAGSPYVVQGPSGG